MSLTVSPRAGRVPGPDQARGRANPFAAPQKGGKAWESNPPQPAQRHLPPILKTGASTGTHPLPPTILLKSRDLCQPRRG